MIFLEKLSCFVSAHARVSSAPPSCVACAGESQIGKGVVGRGGNGERTTSSATCGRRRLVLHKFRRLLSRRLHPAAGFGLQGFSLADPGPPISPLQRTLQLLPTSRHQQRLRYQVRQPRDGGGETRTSLSAQEEDRLFQTRRPLSPRPQISQPVLPLCSLHQTQPAGREELKLLRLLQKEKISRSQLSPGGSGQLPGVRQHLAALPPGTSLRCLHRLHILRPLPQDCLSWGAHWYAPHSEKNKDCLSFF